MRRSRKTKLITMIALVAAVLGMSIGFATFSRILTISSKATVNPNRDTHKLVIYGLVDENEVSKFDPNNIANSEFDFSKWSMTNAFGGTDMLSSKHVATIDNNNFTITNLSADFSLEAETYSYVFAVKNEGENPVYYVNSDIVGNNVCSALENTTQSLIDEVCDKVYMWGLPINPSTGVVESPPYIIEPGDFVLLIIALTNSGIEGELDGPFEVLFPDAELIFSDVLPEVEEVNEE